MNLAYIAGFLDGEGCISFARCRTSIYPRIIVANTNKSILENLQARFGGDIKPFSLRREGWKRGWQWRLSWSKAVILLDKLTPYLVLKFPQAHTVFAWEAIRLRTGKVSSDVRREYLEAIDLLLQRMHWLNQKGIVQGNDPIDAIAMRKAGKSRKKKR